MKIAHFLKTHPALNYAQDLRDICRPLDLLDVVYFSHAHIDNKNNLSAIGIVPEFFKLYFEKGYHNFDLHMANPRQNEEYIIWDAVNRKKQSYSLHEDFKGFDQGHTFSIVLNHAKGKDCFHFATKLGNDRMNGEYLRMLDILKKFIGYFKEKIMQHKELSQSYQMKIPLKKSQGGFLTDESPFNLEKAEESLQSERIYSLIENQYLTKRELECLTWFAKGKTIEETALLLGVKSRTIKAHMFAIKDKLGCVNQFQLGMYYSKLNNF